MNKVKSEVKEFYDNFKKVLFRPEMAILPGQLAYFFVLAIVPTITLISYEAALLNLSTDVIFDFIGSAFSPDIANMLLNTTKDASGRGIGFFLVVIIGIISYFFGTFKKITDYTYSKLSDMYYKITGKQKPIRTIDAEVVENELESNKQINDLDFIFITSSHPINKKIEIIDHFHATVFLERDKKLIHIDPEKYEKDTLKMLKKAKDSVLIQIANEIKAHGGNGILDLKIEYGLIGLGGDSFQITAMGMGVKFKD